jgi:hypothetical protein
MTERVDVKTKAAAEKAIKAGKNINIVAGAFALTLNTNVSVRISGSACPELTLESSAPSIETWESSAPSIETWGSSAPSIVTRGSSAPRIVTWGSSAPRIVTRESSAPRIVTWGSSAPRIETRESSAPRIETWESSAPRIQAFAWSMIQVKGDTLTGTAAETVCLNIRGSSKIEGGHQQIVKLETPLDWCAYYGVRVEDGCAILYKAVGDGFMSQWGVRYAPGTMPKDEQWDGRKLECARGGGLNFSPTPHHTHEFVTNPKHYLECRVKLDDLVIHWSGSCPQKVCAREVAAPLVEVDINGEPVAQENAA